MEGRWIKADRNPNEVLVGDDEFENGWMPRDVMVGTLGERRLGTDMDREKAGGRGRSGRRKWRSTGCWGRARIGESVACTIELATERVDGDVAPMAELGLGQTRAPEVGNNR
jgi:hypothetical protein